MAHSTLNLRREAQQMAIAIWENEGGALAIDDADEGFGRRIESDGAWTVYHVFTGVPVWLKGKCMTGLNADVAAERVSSLNIDLALRRKNMKRSDFFGVAALEAGWGQ